jgi:hypothetical protein
MIQCSVWGKGLQIIFNNVFARGQACLLVVGGHCQNLLYHVVSYDFQIIVVHSVNGFVDTVNGLCLKLGTVALRPNAGHGLLNHEVSRSHTTLLHSL